MRIKTLSVRFLGEPNRKPITFDPFVHYIVSTQNSQGKTTLLRLLLFSLCFDVPMTRGLESRNIETIVTVERDNNEITIIRQGFHTTINHSGGSTPLDLANKKNFSFIRSFVFGVDKAIKDGNLLGTMFIDQDNGWNLLSSGKVTGDLRFNASETISALFSIDTYELDRRISAIERDIKKYQLIEKALELKSDSIVYDSNSEGHNETNTEAEKKWIRRKRLLRRKRELLNAIQRLSDVISSKQNIESYIGELGFMAKETPESKPFILTKDRLFLTDANLDGLKAQKMLRESELRSVIDELENYPSYEKQSDQLFDLNKATSVIDSALQNIPTIPNYEVSSILKGLHKEKNGLVNQRRALLKEGDSSIFLGCLSTRFREHLSFFGVEEKVFNENGEPISVEQYLSRGRHSGAELAKISLSYRLAFHECFCDKTNAKIPLIMDSPGSKELNNDVIKQLLSHTIEYARRLDIQLFISTVKAEELALNETNHHVLAGKAIDLFKETNLLNL